MYSKIRGSAFIGLIICDMIIRTIEGFASTAKTSKSDVLQSLQGNIKFPWLFQKYFIIILQNRKFCIPHKTQNSKKPPKNESFRSQIFKINS